MVLAACKAGVAQGWETSPGAKDGWRDVLRTEQLKGKWKTAERGEEGAVQLGPAVLGEEELGWGRRAEAGEGAGGQRWLRTASGQRGQGGIVGMQGKWKWC